MPVTFESEWYAATRPIPRSQKAPSFCAMKTTNGQADDLADICPELKLTVFTDRDVAENPGRVEEALDTADAFFASLIFDYDQVCCVIRGR